MLVAPLDSQPATAHPDRIDPGGSLYRSDGSGPATFEESVLSTRPFEDPGRYTQGIWTIAIADLDDDGDLDVVSASALEGRLVWHETKPSRQ